MLTIKCKDTGSELDLDKIEICKHGVSKETLNKLDKICNENSVDIEITMYKYINKYSIDIIKLIVNKIEFTSEHIWIRTDGTIGMSHY